MSEARACSLILRVPLTALNKRVYADIDCE